jgi:EAL domain-containing protein (putative c-di-GMP-specific phosphodiesterase class I)
VKPSRLLFEITETEIMSNLDKAREILGEMSKMGLKTALDDFGAGFSSLAYLKNLPVDHLKIDCAFVRDLPNNDFNQAILRAIREVAKIRNIKTVAECVETREQFDLLGELGIDYAQGFFIGRPRSRPYLAEELSVMSR